MNSIDVWIIGCISIYGGIGWLIGWKRMSIICGFTIIWTGIIASLSWTIGQPTSMPWNSAYRWYLGLWSIGTIGVIAPIITATPWKTIIRTITGFPTSILTHGSGCAIGIWCGIWTVSSLITPIVVWHVSPWIGLLETSTLGRTILHITVVHGGSLVFPESMIHHIALWIRIGRVVV
jgi:hypothetical protein